MHRTELLNILNDETHLWALDAFTFWTKWTW